MKYHLSHNSIVDSITSDRSEDVDQIKNELHLIRVGSDDSSKIHEVSRIRVRSEDSSKIYEFRTNRRATPFPMRTINRRSPPGWAGHLGTLAMKAM